MREEAYEVFCPYPLLNSRHDYLQALLRPGNLLSLPGHSGRDVAPYRLTWACCLAATSSRYGWPTFSSRNQSESFGLLKTSVIREATSGYSCAVANTFCM